MKNTLKEYVEKEEKVYALNLAIYVKSITRKENIGEDNR